MSASFGEQLKAAREAQGITLREVSEQTRIALRYLEAMEANDFKVLPGGVFNRSFIKTYAKYIGFDDVEAIRLYQEESHAPSPAEEAELALPRHKVFTDDSVARSPLTNLLLVGGVLLVLAAGMYGFLRWYQQPAQPAVATPTPTPSSSASTPAVVVATTPALVTSPAASPGASPATGAPPPASSFSIQLRAKDKPLYVATGTDGALPLVSILLKPGEARDFAPQQTLTVEYTEPGGELMDIYINGQAIVTPKQGVGKQKIINFVIDRNDYQKFLSGFAPQPTPAQ